MLIILGALLGLIVGSFLNVVIVRLPLHASLKGRSQCVSCNAAVTPRDNIPILSWLCLKGKCRACKEPISVRYPLVEFTTTLLFIGVIVTSGIGIRTFLGFILVSTAIAAAVIDMNYRIIPNQLLAWAALFTLVVLVTMDTKALPTHLLAALTGGGLLLIAALAYPDGMGMGDVKFIALLGLLLGWTILVALAVAIITGTLVGLCVMLHKGVKKGRKTAIPFGPFLAFGGLVAFFVGVEIGNWYLSM